jgi:hypothetical protein
VNTARNGAGTAVHKKKEKVARPVKVSRPTVAPKAKAAAR